MPFVEDLVKSVAATIKALHNEGKYTWEDLFAKPEYNETIIQYAKILGKSITGKIATDLPEEMRKALEVDINVFSHLRTHSFLSEASIGLVDEKGVIKPFYKFEKDIQKLNVAYNQNYLEAEYQFARDSAQMAYNWSQMSDEYELQYRTAQDERVREAHAILHNITLPKEDPFWSEYFPPNGWRCRCTTKEVLPGKYEQTDSALANEKGDKATTELDKNGKNRLAIFRFNPGMDKVVFPPGHPYRKVKDANKVVKLASEVNVANIPASLSTYEQSTGVTIDKSIFAHLRKDVPLKFATGKGAYYNTAERIVNIPLDNARTLSKWKASSTVYHEYGHAIDWDFDLKNNKKVKNLMKKYRDILSKSNNKGFKDLHKKMWDEGFDYFNKDKHTLMHQSVAAQDALMSLNKNFGQGHASDYWDIAGRPEAEFIAHAFENYYNGNIIFKRNMPELYNETIKLVKEILTKL